MESNSTNETVCFDVGGVKHKVSRSLIELYPDTMLARLIAERWQTKQNKEEDDCIFIDRDGELFRHVLLYMRNQKVYLPQTIAEGNLLMELEYYGFENLPPDAIVPYRQDSLLSARFLAKIRLDALQDEQDYWERRSSREAEIMNDKYNYKRLAKSCCYHFVQTGSLKHQDYFDAPARTFEPDVLNVHLVFFGLVCASWNSEYCDEFEDLQLCIEMKIVVAPIESITFDHHVRKLLERYQQEVQEDFDRDFDRAYSLYMDRLREGVYGDVDAENESTCKNCESRDENLVKAKQNQALAEVARECYEIFAENHSLCFRWTSCHSIHPNLLTPDKLDVHLKFFGMQCISVEKTGGAVLVHFGIVKAED